LAPPTPSRGFSVGLVAAIAADLLDHRPHEHRSDFGRRGHRTTSRLPPPREQLPCRCATSDTTAPGASVSSTIRTLSSSEKRRRRPVPVSTSSRLTLLALGSSVWSSVDTSRSPFRDRSSSAITRAIERWARDTAYADGADVIVGCARYLPGAHAGEREQTGAHKQRLFCQLHDRPRPRRQPLTSFVIQVCLPRRRREGVEPKQLRYARQRAGGAIAPSTSI
jgi:hypothetical protein